MKKILISACVVLIIFTLLTLLRVDNLKSISPVDISPENWKSGDLEKMNVLYQQIVTREHYVEGKNGVIVGLGSPQSQRAGLEALLQGGSAADAVLTASLTAITLEAGSYYSYAGFMTMMYYDVIRIGKLLRVHRCRSAISLNHSMVLLHIVSDH